MQHVSGSLSKPEEGLVSSVFICWNWLESIFNTAEWQGHSRAVYTVILQHSTTFPCTVNINWQQAGKPWCWIKEESVTVSLGGGKEAEVGCKATCRRRNKCMLKESMLRPCSALCSVCINATLDFKFLHITDMKVAFWKVLPAFLYVLLPALPVQVINKLCEDCWWNKLSQTSHKKTEGTLVFSPL